MRNETLKHIQTPKTPERHKRNVEILVHTNWAMQLEQQLDL